MRMSWLKGACAATALAVAFSATAVHSNAPMRQVEVRLTDHKPGIADFKQLTVGLKGISIHSRGAPRKTGWLDLIDQVPPVDIVPLKDGKFEKLGTSRIPAGRYDAIRINFSMLNGELHSGSRPALSARDTTVAVGVDIRDAGATILLDLFAENQTDHAPNRYVIKVKEVLIGR